jgi:hypothetical protein
MSDKENEVDNQAIDPPENTGGGNVTGAGLESNSEAAPIDPPENTGGGN